MISDTDRVNRYLIHFFSLILCFLAAYFYLERTLPFDAAFYSFKISESGTFSIENYRYGVFYTQLFPLLFLKAGCSLKTFLLVYSLSFALWNYIFCLIILYVYKKPGIALALVLTQVLAYRISFFYPVSEIHSCMGLLLLLAAHLAGWNSQKPIRSGSILLLFIVWLTFIHVLSIVPIAFIIGYFIIRRPALIKDKAFYIPTLLGLILFIVQLKMFSAGSYQASKMIGLKEIMEFLEDPGSSTGYIFFMKEFMSLELTFVICLAGFIVLCIVFRKFIILGYSLLFLAGTWVLIMAYNMTPESPLVLQNYYPLFGIFIALPLAQDLLPLLPRPWIRFIILIPVFSFSLLGIIRKGVFMSDQTAYFQRIAAQPEAWQTERYVVHSANINWDNVMVTWDLSFQSLLASSLGEPVDSHTCFCSGDTAQINNWCRKDNQFYSVEWCPVWFNTPFTKTSFYTLKTGIKYKLLNTAQEKSFPDSLLTPSTVSISTANDSIFLLRNNYRILPVTLSNSNDFTIPSRPTPEKQLLLTYDVSNEHGQIILLNGCKSALEADILPHSYLQTGLNIDMTRLERGTYFLNIDLICNDTKRVGINHKVRILIL
ncbi:MAG: hypothetical protein ACHQRM_03510 [Bacteroidia bacterium]